MNKTLLLIICDFLLLNLLALTRWEKAEPPSQARPPVPELAANAATKDQDLVETMRQSLADEKAQRDELAQKLASTESNLGAREQSLTAAQAGLSAAQTESKRLAAERATLSSSLSESQKNAAELAQRAQAAAQEATMTKEQLAQLQRELADRQAEAERQKQALSELNQKQADSLKQIQDLNLAKAQVEQERADLRERASDLQNQVTTERNERVKAQEATTQIASGFGQLAEKSGELTQEIRSNRPINANVLFNDFLANRVTTTITTHRRGLLGGVDRNKEARTVLVTDGKQIYALMHVADTVFNYNENGSDWEKLSIEFSHPPSYHSSATQMNFLAQDPRIVVVPVTADQATALGAKVYPLATDPFKFPEAVLIAGGGAGYGEVGFKLDASQPGFVRVDNRLFKRLFGDFAPSRGDLVFSKTGELLGIMVNSDYCAVLKDFSSSKTFRTGDSIVDQHTGQQLDDLGNRMRSLPMKLQ